MNNYSIDTKIKNGHLELSNIPIPDDVNVKVVIIPKIKLSDLSLDKSNKLSKSIKGNISDDINSERDER